MAITKQQIVQLRNETGAGIMDSKEALEGANGDFEVAKKKLVEQGIASAAKRKGSDAREGTVASYIHAGGRAGALVELRCETDFVARTDAFRDLARDLAMQVVAMTPKVVSRNSQDGADGEELPVDAVLVEQDFIKDPSVTVDDVIKGLSGKVGENIYVGGFQRFSLND